MAAATPHSAASHAAPLRMRHALRTHGGADEFRTCGHHLLYGSGARAVYWYIPQRVTHVSPPGHWAGTVIGTVRATCLYACGGGSLTRFAHLRLPDSVIKEIHSTPSVRRAKKDLAPRYSMPSKRWRPSGWRGG